MLVMLIGSAGGSLRAQLPAPPAPVFAVSKPPAFDVSKLPMDLDRVQRKLREALDGDRKAPLIVRFTVDVFAQAPRIDLFNPSDNFRFAQVRTVTPTHRELMNIVTPVPWGRR